MISIEKKLLREETLKKRNSQSQYSIQNKSKKILDRATPILKDAKSIFTYISMNREVDTLNLIEKYIKQKTIIVPYVKNRLIYVSELKDINDLKVGKYGILEPSQIIQPKTYEIDVSLVPGVAFDQKGNRVGFGKGYYDRILKKIKGIKIGLCFDFQIKEKLPYSSHDVRMDTIITEKRKIIINCNT